MKNLNEIILEWIGKDQDGNLSIGVHSVEAIGNQVLSDLRSRVPELVEKVEQYIMDNEPDMSDMLDYQGL